jgi:hypothetical protein
LFRGRFRKMIALVEASLRYQEPRAIPNALARDVSMIVSKRLPPVTEAIVHEVCSPSLRQSSTAGVPASRCRSAAAICSGV